jgi:hypothetical protein
MKIPIGELFSLRALAFATIPTFGSSQSVSTTDETSLLWSMLIPQVEQQPGRGYMVAQQSAIADGLPSIQTGAPKTAIQRAMDASKQTGRTYETQVPETSRSAFLEAVHDASVRKLETRKIERLALSRPYRLLTKDDVRAYLDLSPAAIGPNWHPDAKAAQHFHGWDQLGYLSVPYFDTAKSLAILWSGVHSGCYCSRWYFFGRNDDRWTKLDWNTEAMAVCA